MNIHEKSLAQVMMSLETLNSSISITPCRIQIPLDEYENGPGMEQQGRKMIDMNSIKGSAIGKQNRNDLSSSSLSSLDELRRDLQDTLEAAESSHSPFITSPLLASLLAGNHTSVVSDTYAMCQIINGHNIALCF